MPGLVPQPARLPGLGRWQVDTVAPRIWGPVAWSPDSRFVACASGRQVRVYEMPNLRLVRIWTGQELWASALDWHPDGRTLATADNTLIRLCSATTGQPGPVPRAG